MIHFRDLPIRRKVARMLILTGGVVLLLTSSAFMVYEWRTFRGAALANLQTVSRIIAENSNAAVRFNNEQDAQETIGTLRADPDIVMGRNLQRGRKSDRVLQQGRSTALPIATCAG